MFSRTRPKTYASRQAVEVWRAAAHLVCTRWQTYLDADAERRRFAFASYLAALDAEEAAAADVAESAARDRDLVHLRFKATGPS